MDILKGSLHIRHEQFDIAYSFNLRFELSEEETQGIIRVNQLPVSATKAQKTLNKELKL
jgi:hypothetical protein